MLQFVPEADALRTINLIALEEDDAIFVNCRNL
jgi:hypothetical protein